MDQLTLKEYDWLMEACELRLVDEEFIAHRQAFLNMRAQAADAKGRPVYRRFEKFYDYDKAIRRAKKKEPSDGRFSRLKQYLREGNNNG